MLVLFFLAWVLLQEFAKNRGATYPIFAKIEVRRELLWCLCVSFVQGKERERTRDGCFVSFETGEVSEFRVTRGWWNSFRRWERMLWYDDGDR